MASPGMICRRGIQELPDEVLLAILACMYDPYTSGPAALACRSFSPVP